MRGAMHKEAGDNICTRLSKREFDFGRGALRDGARQAVELWIDQIWLIGRYGTFRDRRHDRPVILITAMVS